MYLVVASRVDVAARELAAAMGAPVLTPADLSEPGWRLGDRDEPSVFVASGVEHLAEELRGVLVRLPCVYPEELIHIEEEARPYVAAEMTATLKYWLGALRCRVLNPATAGCLAGPSWRPEHWNRCAVSAGVPVLTLGRGTAVEARQEGGQGAGTVTVIGDAVLEPDSDPRLAAWTKALANRAHTPLLSATYVAIPNRGPCFAWAETFPPLDALAAGPILRHLAQEAAA